MKMKWKTIVVRQERDEWGSDTTYAFVPVKPKPKRKKRRRRNRQ